MTNAHPAKTFPLAIFGLPFTNASLQESVAMCMDTLRRGRFDRDSFVVNDFDASFISHAYGWGLSSVRQAELLAIARQTDLSLISNRYLRTLCKCLGSEISEEITRKGLLLALCQELDKLQKSLYVLGGTEKTNKAAAIKLHDRFNKLRLVGVSTPRIYTKGEDLVNSRERDALLVEQINATYADVLVVNLGTPKQELWVGRTRQTLKVPLIFCSGHLLEQILEGGVPARAGFWGRWRDLFKITWMALPLVVYHTINRSVYQWFYESEESARLPKEGCLYLSAHRSIAFISLPQVIDETNVAMLRKHLDDAMAHDVIVLDFFATRHIQLEGFAMLIQVWQDRQRRNKAIFGFRPTADVRCLMKVHRTWGIFGDAICESAETLIAHLSPHDEMVAFYDTFTQTEDLVAVRILGSLTQKIDYDLYMKKLTPTINEKDVLLDLSCCTMIDNSGFAFLLTLRKHLHLVGRKLTLSGVSKALKLQFIEAGLEGLT